MKCGMLHILFTEDYAAFCDATAGSYLHHRVPENEEARIALGKEYKNTLRIYEENFGTADKSAWGESAQICWCETLTRTKERQLVAT